MNQLLLLKTNLSSLSDHDLVKSLQAGGEQYDLKTLQFEFYSRYAGHIYKAALYDFRNYRDPESLAKEVIQLTFTVALKKISEFTFPFGSTPDDTKKIIKAWIGRIAENQTKKAIGELINDKIDYDSLKMPEPIYDHFENIYGEPIPEIPNEFRQKLQEAMGTLSEKERHIIRTYAGEGCILTNGKKHISDASLKYLCEYYKTTTDAIKQCKKRALDKIKKICYQ